MPARSLRVFLPALGLIAALLLPVGTTTGQPSPPALTEVAFLTSATAQSATKWQGFDGSNLVFADINGDGLPEIVASNDNLRHYVLDPRQGLVVAELHGTHHGGDGWAGRELNGPAVGDVFGTGVMDVAIDDGDSYLSLWQYDAANSTSSHFAMQKLWENYVNTQAWDPNFNQTHPYNTNDSPASEAHPYLADVDGHGQMTIFAQADNIAAHVAYWPNGTLRWFTDPEVDSNAGVIVADLNGDGKLEAVYASDGGPVYVQDPKTGAALWTFDTRCTGGYWQGDGSNCDWSQVGSVTLSPTVADLFGDGKKEICFGTREAVPESDPGWYKDNASIQANVDASHAKLWCLTHDGKLLWMDQLPFGNPHSAMHPVPFDVNGDGVRDLLWIDWNSIGHRPGNWQTTTRGPNLMALDGKDGHVLWNTTLHSGWSNKDLSLLDLYGDGRQEIIAEEYGPTGDDGLGVFDPHTGQRLAWYPLEKGWGATRGPLVADLYHDGYMEIVVPLARWHTANDGWCPQQRADMPCREGAIEILATHKPYSSQFSDSFAWNHDLDAHALDAKPRTETPAGPATPWPNEANARVVVAYGSEGPVPIPPSAAPPTPSSPTPPTNATMPTPTPTPSPPSATTSGPGTTSTPSSAGSATQPTAGSPHESSGLKGVPGAQASLTILAVVAAMALGWRRRG